MTEITLAVVGVVVVVLVALITPFMYAVGGYFTGWVLMDIFAFAGDWVVAGAAGLDLHITRDMLPVIGAFLGFVGSFFRATQSNKVEKK